MIRTFARHTGILPAGCTVLSLVMALSGCASSTPGYVYVPPGDHSVRHETTVYEGFEVVWDRLMEGFSRAPYKILFADESEGKINVLLSSNEPETLVDCGTVSRGVDEYEVARSRSRRHRSSASYRAAGLEARADIHLEPRGDRTRVALDVWYILSVKTGSWSATQITNERVIEVPMEDAEGNVVGTTRRTIPGKTSTRSSTGEYEINFTTSHVDSANVGSSDEPRFITCCSKGRLEDSILALASGD